LQYHCNSIAGRRDALDRPGQPRSPPAGV